MITLFRRIRQQLITENRFSKYLVYAIGEIILVVIGILIALQINNWNEARKARSDFEFGLREVYTQMKVNYFDLLASRERVDFQLRYIDTLLNDPGALQPEDIPGIIQLQDYRGLSSDIDQQELFEPFLKLAKDDKVQNELAKSLRKNFLIANYYESTHAYNFEGAEYTVNLFDHLRNSGIPLRFMKKAPSYREFIRAPSTDFYTGEQLHAVAGLLNDPIFQADLKTIRYIKQEYLRQLFELENIYTSSLDFLDRNYPNSRDRIDKMEIIGSGIPSSNWAIGIPMTKIGEGIFEIELDLIPGEIKFRSDQNYTYDWGGSQMDVKKLAFKGTNIPVSQGKSRIRIDINDMDYSLTPIE